jgi:hypothetical protein
MSTIRFTTDIGTDQIIHPPPGIQLPPGHAEVTVVQDTSVQTPVSPKQDFPPGVPQDIQKLIRFARQVGPMNLPTDYALNHDYYLHGAPKKKPKK